MAGWRSLVAGYLMRPSGSSVEPKHFFCFSWVCRRWGHEWLPLFLSARADRWFRDLSESSASFLSKNLEISGLKSSLMRCSVRTIIERLFWKATSVSTSLDGHGIGFHLGVIALRAEDLPCFLTDAKFVNKDLRGNLSLGKKCFYRNIDSLFSPMS